MNSQTQQLQDDFSLAQFQSHMTMITENANLFGEAIFCNTNFNKAY